MDLVHDFDYDVSYILEKCEKSVLSYPTFLKEKGHEYLEKLHLLKDNTQSGGFCYLMPFWLKDTFKIDPQTCRIMALGNTFGLLYFMSQDDIMDNNCGELLPLSNLFFLDFIAQYRLIFPSDSTFWSYFDGYICEWAASVAWERIEHWGQYKAYTEEDLILLSRKAAPTKIPFAAICILSENECLIPHFSRMVDYDQITYQMIDDWRDWQDDIASGNCTYLLSKVVEYCQLSSLSELTASHFQKAVYIGDVAEKVFEMATKYNKLSGECITSVNSVYLNSYLDLVAGLCNKITSKLILEKENMLSGGLNNLLWKLTKK